MKTWLFRFLTFTVLWVILSGADFDVPWMVGVIILLAAATSIYVLPPGGASLRPLAVLCFFPYFLKQSLFGGWDVARRAFSPKMPLNPDLIVFSSALSKPQKVLLAWTASLLPGTAAIEVKADHLKIHVLDHGKAVEADLRELEARISKLFKPDTAKASGADESGQ